MITIIHRVNTVEQLNKVPSKYGVEIDIRSSNGKLILNHDPYVGGELLDDYLKFYNHKFIIFNIKETGIELDVIALAKKYSISDYFLLDVEYPFIYRAISKYNIKDIAIRYSESEPIEFALFHEKKVNWVWVDTNTSLPLNQEIAQQLSGFKIALVSPEPWGRPEDIIPYKEYLINNNISIDAVMVDLEYAHLWEDLE